MRSSRRRIGTALLSVVVLGAGLLAAPDPADAQAAPTIDVWYGDVQAVGAVGRSQVWTNVLGRVRDVDGDLVGLTYRLNGGAPRPLTIGPGGNPRLVRGGDFNVEIDRAELTAGNNQVLLEATDAAGTVAQRTVVLQHTPGRTWPLPTTVSWAGATTPAEVADVVDGRWALTPGGATVAEDGYDRLLAVGDVGWTNYQVEVPVTIHDMDANIGGIGFLMRWTGHTEQSPHVAGMQPRIGWQPSGALAWYRARYGQPARVEVDRDDETVLGADGSGFTLLPGATYTFRASVVRTAQGDDYQFSVFPVGTSPASGVTVRGLDTSFTKSAGSVLLVAHRSTVTFGDITAVPLEGPPPPPPPVNVAPVAADDVASTSVGVPVGVPVLGNDSDPDGSLVASSVQVVSGPSNGSVSVDPGSGVVTYTPAAGFGGSDSFTYRVADDQGAWSNVASVAVTVSDSPPPPPPPPPSGLVSDEFSSGLGSQWRWVDPVGDATLAVSGGAARLSVPSGVSHDLWTGAFRAPRLVQSSPDGDFEVEAKIDSPVTARFQLQGIVVQEDGDDLVRAEFHQDGTGVQVFVATFDGGQPTPRAHAAVPFTASFWMRVARSGDQWVVRVSDDGVVWQTAASFTHDMVVNEVGVFSGNHNPNPAHTAIFDHFRVVGAAPPPPPPPVNVAPVAADDVASTSVGVPVGVPVLANDSDPDGSLVASSVQVVSGPANGSASVDPASGVVTYAPGAGFVGTDTFTYRVADDRGAWSNTATATLTVTDAPPPPPPPPPPSGLVTDEFSSGLGSQWRWVDPVGDATLAVSAGAARLSVPAGEGHDLWSGRFRAPRLVQSSPDGDFEVEAKIDSPVTARFQLQGLLASADGDDLVRADFHQDGSGVQVFVATFVGGQPNVRAHATVPFTASFWMRLARTGDQWVVRISDDGVVWQTAASFTHDMVVNEVGVFSGNHTPNPAHTAVFDHFRVIGSAPPPPPPPPPANVAPVAADDVASTSVGVPVGVPVLGNDSDPDGSLVASSVQVVSGPANGSASVDPASGVVTYTPAAGFVGSDGFTYRVADDQGAWSNVASVAVTVSDSPPPPPPPPPSGLVSDEFSSGLGSQWRWVDPVGDATLAVSAGAARLSVPAGEGHDLWSGRFRAPRLVQATADQDFEVEAKIDSPVTARFQLQGIVVQEDGDDLVRAEFHQDGSGVQVFVATFDGGEPNVRAHAMVPFTASFWMRVARAGDQWVVRISDDGIAWQTAASFSHDMVVNEVGVFSGNHNPNPAHTAIFDHFRVVGAAPPPPPPVNVAPVAADDVASTSVGVPVGVPVLGNDSDPDGSLVASSVQVVSGPTNGSASVDPASGLVTYAPGAGFVGTDAFTYRVADDRGAWSNTATATLTVTDAPPPAIGFASTVIDATVDQTHAVAAADLDGDGDVDAVTTDYVDGIVTWYENQGAGSFDRHVVDDQLVGAYPVSVGDVDADGALDVLAGGYTSNTFAWYENDGAGSFTKHVVSTSAQGAHSITTADLDADGHNDLLVTMQDAGVVAWYRNDGSEQFSLVVLDPTFPAAKRAEAADLDGDGDLDVVAAAFGANLVAWYENGGAGTFTRRPIDESAFGAYYADAADLDGDGDVDVVAAAAKDGTVVWYENDGAEGFTRRVLDGRAFGARTVIAADIDGDADLDVLAASADDDRVVLHRNDGPRLFTAVPVATVDGAYGVAAADVDGDGRVDVLSAARDAGSLVLHRQSAGG